MSEHSDGITLHSNGDDFAVETAPGEFAAEIDPVTRTSTGKAKRFRMTDNGSSRLHLPGQPHRTVADLSSRDRSALMDETLMTVHELLLQVAGMGQAILALKREKDALEATVTTLQTDVDNLNKRSANTYTDVRELQGELAPFITAALWPGSFWQQLRARLRWILTGR